jgi:hypothetical protein
VVGVSDKGIPFRGTEVLGINQVDSEAESINVGNVGNGGKRIGALLLVHC